LTKTAILVTDLKMAN